MDLMMLANTMDYSKPIADISEKLSFGGMMVLIGMGAVFSVLVIIWLALTIFKAVFQRISGDKKTNTAVAKPVSEPVTAPVDADEEIVAVIAAAIAMAESESDGIKFKVVSFRRV